MAPANAGAIRILLWYTDRYMNTLIRFLIKAGKTFILGAVAVFGGITGLFITFVGLLILLVIIGSAALSESSNEYQHVYGDKSAEQKIAVLSVQGLILGEQTEETKFLEVFSDIGVTYGYEVQDQLRELAEDDDVFAVLLDINSPGGTIFGSKAIADGVAAYKTATGKPVYAYVSGIAASGGYWVAASADSILVDYGTSIGSIGVIMGPFKQYGTVISESQAFGGGVETTDGITTEYITAGKHKDLGNPYRELTTEERETLQAAVDATYTEFVQYVSEQREIDQDVLTNQLGALIFNDIQAAENGLADGRYSKTEAYQHIADAQNVLDFKVITEPTDSTVWDFVLEAQSTFSRPAQQRACLLQTQTLVYSGSVSALCN